MIRRPPRSTLSSSSAASDVYKRQEEDSAPGFGPGGLSLDGSVCVLVLFRVEKNQINHVWVCEDEDRLAANPNTSKAGMQASDSWDKIVDIIRASMKGSVTCHFSNYNQTEDTTGLGLGESTKTVSFPL
eukprot:TRINITY_DN24154_c0_g1_i2.p1 TRINITY_DN24154_c0_g1~~TRINITY_DN24154_c0_g1_i2.p1  ORF type:complete len:129 (+),score=33.35 TRINITY_DN24154_c0_g1_i2:68-454(+)